MPPPALIAIRGAGGEASDTGQLGATSKGASHRRLPYLATSLSRRGRASGPRRASNDLDGSDSAGVGVGAVHFTRWRESHDTRY
jgi:hypothetical protein